MKIANEIVIASIENLINSTTNKFWGLISIFSSVNKHEGLINNSKTYKVNAKDISERLEDLFYYGESLKTYNNNSIYFRLSKNWTEGFDDIILKNKPNILDVAIFYFKNKSFATLNSKEIVELLINSINLPLEVIENIFDIDFINNDLKLEENYSTIKILDSFKQIKNIKLDYLTFSFEKPYLIVSRPSELKRAPFIQTLYSGTKIQELLLITDFNLDDFYFSSNDLNNLSKGSKATNIIYYGSPGTGKSHAVDQILKENEGFYERITFHPEFDNASFIGGYKPMTKDGVINYEFVPQAFTNIYVKAWLDLNKEKTYYLAIEEINRGNCAEIFGDVFQLLDRNSNYTVSPSNELKEYLIGLLGEKHEGIKNGLKLPPNLSLLATMNTSDQSLFPMDSAFKRRWDWEYIPICYDKNAANKSSNYFVKIDETNFFNWIDFIKAVNHKIKHNRNLGPDKCIGNYFIKPQENEISLKEFVNKAIFYLWNDVFKDEDQADSIFKEGVHYEDFFPIETEGKKLLLEILKTNDFKEILQPADKPVVEIKE